jgi:glycosyltransferase involved in cell wall biosynthesis
MPSKIIVDGAFFQIGRSGIARVWTKLLQHWVTTGFAQEVVVLDRNRSCARIDGIRYRDVPPFGYNNLEGDRQMLQAVCDDEKADLFISTYYTYPLTTPSAMLIYDMIPEVMGWDLGQPMWLQKQGAMRYARFFAAISENSAKDLRVHLGKPDLPVEIAYTGSDFVPASPAAIDSFRTRHGIHQPYFLISGTRGGYKNVALFFKAFELLGDERAHYHIVCTGGGQIEPEFAAAAGPAQVHVVILDDNDMQAAYSGAISLVYPSLYEGFGLPVLEAMACDCPVITTRLSSIPEVGGEVPLYIDIHEQAPEQLASHLRAVQEPARRKAMIAAGRLQASKFCWDTMGEIMQRFLGEAATASRNHAAGEACRLCQSPTRAVFSKRVLGRYEVRYEQCDQCGAVQTERPHWLEEAHAPGNSAFDTGQVTRSLVNAAVLNTLLPLCGLKPDSRVLDYGCGAGLLVRTLRDIGWDAWGHDRYAKVTLAAGFQATTRDRFDVINLCEVVADLDEPRAEFERVFAQDPQVVLIQSGMTQQVAADWGYLAPEQGQHVFFMTPKTVDWLAARHGRVALQVMGFHVLVKPDLAAGLIDPQTGALKAEHQQTMNNALVGLWQGLFAQPYRHAERDAETLRQRRTVPV